MDNSSLKGTDWYWREGYRQMPMPADCVVKTSELFSCISSLSSGTLIKNELKANGIQVDIKTTHSSFGKIPSGTLIIYADLNQDKKILQEEKNIQRLKTYIASNGGQIHEKKTVAKGFLARLLGLGRNS